MTVNQRRQAIDFGKIRGTGMHIPSGMIPVSARAHILNLYYEKPPTPAVTYFWTNKISPQTSWEARAVTATTWTNRASPATKWTNRGTPVDGSTNTEH